MLEYFPGGGGLQIDYDFCFKKTASIKEAVNKRLLTHNKG